jgi:hypothetical protein
MPVAARRPATAVDGSGPAGDAGPAPPAGRDAVDATPPTLRGRRWWAGAANLTVAPDHRLAAARRDPRAPGSWRAFGRPPEDAKRRERDERIRSLDERIGECVSQALASGELQGSPAWGRPLPDDRYFDVPPELRLAFKVLRGAGHLPAEVEMLQEIERWRARLATLPDDAAEAAALRQRIAERRLLVQLRIERLARTLTL